MIDGVQTKKLVVHADDRGRLMEILRKDDSIFERFGQVYITTAYPGVVKAWHYHNVQTDHFCVVYGMMKVVLYDARKGSPTEGRIDEYVMGVHNPIVLKIPPGVFHGFTCLGEREAICINVPTEPYNPDSPDEFREPAHGKIPYDWTRKDY